MTTTIHRKPCSMGMTLTGVKPTPLVYWITCKFPTLKPLVRNTESLERLMLLCVARNWLIVARSKPSAPVTLVNIKQ